MSDGIDVKEEGYGERVDALLSNPALSDAQKEQLTNMIQIMEATAGQQEETARTIESLKAVAGKRFSDQFLDFVSKNDFYSQFQSAEKKLRLAVMATCRQLAADMGFIEGGSAYYVNPENKQNSGVGVEIRTVSGNFTIEISADGQRIMIVSHMTHMSRGDETFSQFAEELKRDGVFIPIEIIKDFEKQSVSPFTPDPPSNLPGSFNASTNAQHGPRGFKTASGYINGTLISYSQYFAIFETPQGILQIPISDIHNFEYDNIQGPVASSVRHALPDRPHQQSRCY